MVEFTVKQQTIHFLYYVLVGMSVGLLFDGFRSIRVRYRRNKLLTHVLDVIFGLICAVYITMAFYQLDGVMLGIFNIIGSIIGLILYFLLFCRFFRAFFQKILGFFIKIFKILLYPILFLCKIGSRFFFFLKKPLYKLKKRFMKWCRSIAGRFMGNIKLMRKKMKKH